MEWTWLRDWWRLKRLRHSQLRHSHEDIYYGHNSDDEDDDDDICYCDECVDGDIDLCGGDPNDGIDSDCSASSNSGKQVLVGICAMAKKAQSKPMTEILTRLREFDYIHMIIFDEEVILKEPVEKWPLCDCLVSFHSKGFPLEKAIQYASLRKCFTVNNLPMQYDIQDRRKVYAILESVGIEIPRYAVLDRDSPDPKHHELVESEDHVEVNGITFNKPFVEKPVSAEDHNIYIYYPTSAGGGSQRLFRKIGSRSSVYSPESRVRKTGSFIYEDFMPTDGTDVKVYTVGPDYAHAEARKSPALDGKVERDSQGKEIRYPVILSNAEKLISRKVCMAFKQTVCGFDLLRANGKSFVCDVNGFSFVKNSNKYYDDCAKILGNMILRELTPTLHIPWSVPFQLDDPPIVPTTFGKMMELRCVVAVIRHGDRTPKQKMKVEVKHPKFFEIFEKYDGYKHGHIKLKRPKQLQEILDIARYLLSEIQTKSADAEVEEKQGKLEQLKGVLEMYGHFSGINRKVQMKYQPKGRPRGSSSDDGNGNITCDSKEPSLVLILKWGGELTPAGRIQAEELGRIFRCMYPGGQGTSRHDQSGTQGLGLLRLHSTFRHDLKIYASDEGRVQMTAAAFAKGLLALEGELTPILVQMVKSANTNGLLDNDCESSKVQNMAKNRLHELMQLDHEFTDEDRMAINPTNSISIAQAITFVKNPAQCCTHVHELIKSLLTIIGLKKDDLKTRDAILYHGETWDLMARRWGKIEKDFCTKNKFDISKIPDIYDCIKYDLQHNQHTLQYEQAEELYLYAKYLADIVIPQEYGITLPEKLTIGTGICTPLLKKIKADLQRNIEEVENESVNRLNPHYSHGVTSPGRHVRTRLYFTSESHIHSLLTVLRSGGLVDVMTDEQWRRAMEYISIVSELNYMSQIVVMLYEDPTKNVLSEERFHVELHFSPGVNCCVQKNLPPGPGFRPHSRNDSIASKNTSGEDDSAPARIDEESDSPQDEQKKSVSQKSVMFSIGDDANDATENPPRIVSKHRHTRASKPIPIGMHHTVCGSEAVNLAKRLNEELASQQVTQCGSLGNTTTTGSTKNSPEELRSRSLEQGDKSKEEHFDPYKALSQSTRLKSVMTYESATNELPLSSITFDKCNESPDPDKLHRLNFDRYDVEEGRHAMSPSATNERPLSCTCLPNMFNDDPVNAPGSFYGDINDEFLFSEPILSSSCPIPHGHFPSNDNQIFSADFKERLNDYNAFREHKRSHAPRIFLNNQLPKMSDLKSMQKAKLSTDITTTDGSECSLPNLPIDSFDLKQHSIHSTTNTKSFATHAVFKKPIVTSSPQLSSDPSVCNAYSLTKSKIISTSSNSTNSKNVPNVNNTTIPHPNIVKIHNSDGTQSTQCSTKKQARHSIPNQMGFFKIMDIAGGFSRKMATSTNSLFSTAVISGSSSAPNLHQINTASPSVLEGIGGVPNIRPLETLHNALSLKQLDAFLEKMTTTTIFKTPASSPPKYPSTPLLTPTQTPHNSLTDKPGPLSCWSGQSSMTGSLSAMSSGGPSSPENSYSTRSELSTSIISSESVNLPSVNELSQMFPTLDGELGSVANHFRFDHLVETVNECAECIESELKTPLQNEKQFPASSIDHVTSVPDEEDEEPTLSTDFASNQKESIFTSHSDGVESEATKLLEAIINKSPPKRRPEKLSTISKSTLARSTNYQIQKQTSLHGGEGMPTTTTTSREKQRDSINRFPRRNFEYSRFMSVDQRSQSDTEDNVAIIEPGHMKTIDSKTQSCANLKLSSTSPRSPGALVVKEKYIELPKHVAQSIRSNASSSSRDQEPDTKSTSLTSSTESIARLSVKVTPRFTTIKVDESQLGASVSKEVQNK
ncbi:inositol hexakisphosphate and diphosphoinositol-pentakisphosphate kinase isoform X4 [Contarinia nasturtii]|uniref:inositol hexakisphosphate and diphosphoinositol-pentakisphosphate kinase isoform X4 n=1 Tax=Contarinia nasturtii TaxID=265458 RepID=UPI0012D3E2DF|nr:inositol hexakisphosphate and diphosphoinositol-pentakisphosphate kinase isoform X4 [Contarinia nasturtii]